MVTCLFSVDDNAWDAPALIWMLMRLSSKKPAARHLQHIEFSDDGFASDSIKIRNMHEIT
jgi:hypothetical protein